MQKEVDYIKVKNPKNLMTTPELVRPVRKPDFTIKDTGAFGMYQVHWWLSERVCEFKDKESNKPELSYFMIDPVWGIFVDETWGNKREAWGLADNKTLDAFRSWALEQAVFDE